MKKCKRLLSVTLVVCLLASLFATTALADSSFTFTTPTEAMDVSGSSNVLTTLTQRAGSEIPLVFGLNVVGGNMFSGLQYLAGTVVNENPDPYVWNYNYLNPDNSADAADRDELPEGTYYKALGNTLNNPNGLYSSGGANQNYSVAVDELGGVGYAVGYRNDVIIGFNSQTVDQIDLVRSWTEGDEYYQEGDEDYSPLIIDVQTGSVTSRLYSWTEMGQALSAYLAANPDKTTRYDDPYTIAVNLEQFSAGIPYYIASLIADGTIEKKTAAYVSAIDGYTMTCVDPGTVGNVSADVYAEVENFDFVTGSFTLADLMSADVDLIILGATGYGYSGNATAMVGGGQAATDSSKQDILAELASLGYTADQMPLVMDASTIAVKIGNNGYNYAPITCMFMPYVQAYAYMDELAQVNEAINPVAMVQYLFDEFCHVEESASADVALYYIGSNWDSVDEEYDRVPDLANYVYDKDAIAAAIKTGISYALSDAAAANGNTLLAAYRTTDNAYVILTEQTTTVKPADDHEYITLTIDGQTKYLDLTALAAASGADTAEVVDSTATSEYSDVRTEYQAIIDYYNSGAYGYGDDLQTTLQNYADHMVAHVWEPATDVEGTYGYGLKASETAVATTQTFSDVPANAWYATFVNYVAENGVMTGMSETTFNPLGTLSRAQMCQIIYNMAGRPDVTETSGYSDVNNSAWYAKAVNWCITNGIADGRSDTAFAPTANITREEVADILYRYTAYQGKETPAGDLSAFTDTASITKDEAMSWAVGAGLINGVTDTTLVPGGTATRAQIAAMMQRFCEAA
jgi:hypothetical protein